MARMLRLVATLVCAVAVPASAVAQSAGGVVRVHVRDPQGRAVPGADVELICGTEVRRAIASAQGEIVERNLPDGRCTVRATSESFETATATVDAGPPAPILLVLPIRRFSSEVVVTPAHGIEEEAYHLPDAMSVTSRRDIETRPHTLFAQVLREEPGVLLQQTTTAQASPVIRGFTGQANLHLLDGVRVNTASWRAGPNQYFAWVPAGVVDRIEVVRGGGSVQYGSDALGGTVQLVSGPVVAARARRLGGRLEISGASADQSVGGQGDVAFQAGRSAIRVGGGGRRVRDLRGGGGLDSRAAVTRFLGLPSAVLGSRYRATGYDERSTYAVADIGAGRASVIHALYTHHTQAGVHRYDRLLGGAGLFGSGFNPQTLDFGLIRFSRPDWRGWDGVSGTFSFNRQADGRFEQARPSARLDRQRGTTTALGYQLQGHRALGSHQQLIVGGDAYAESIGASREFVDPDGSIRIGRPDIPDGTSYTSLGVFVQHRADVLPERLTVRTGVRFSRFMFHTDGDPRLGVTEDAVRSGSLTFQAASVLRVADGLHLTTSVSRAFRAPNASDLGSIGLTGGGGFEISPARAVALGALAGTTGGAGGVSTGRRVERLRAEVVYQYELGLKARAGRLHGTVNGFDLELFDFIQRRALFFDHPVVGTAIAGFEIVRQDAAGLAYVAEDLRPVATRVNVNRARVRGFDGEAEFRLGGGWTASGYFSMANGRTLPAGDYVRRMAPPMGGARLRWQGRRTWAEAVVGLAGTQRRLNGADLADARIGAPRSMSAIGAFFNGSAVDLGLVSGGVLLSTGERLPDVQRRVLGDAASAVMFPTHPGYAVASLRAGLRITSQFDLSLIGENLGDVNYRLFGSGVDAPGVNIQLRTRYRF